MSLFVFLTVMGAAILHAVWNALVKGAADKTVSMTAVVLGHAPLAGITLFLCPCPKPKAYPI